MSRGLTRKDAAAYCGCSSLTTFSDWVRRGIVPGPISGTHIWDRKAIDAALDRASGLAPTQESSEYASWKKTRASAP
jgi:hypothetical protein